MNPRLARNPRRDKKERRRNRTKITMQRPITAELVTKERKQSMLRRPRVDNQETTISPTGEIVDDRTSAEREKKRCHL